MRTACFDAVAAISARVGELRLLIEDAKSVEQSDEALHNALCRACSVLMAAQLEGFVKEFSKALLSDFNYYVREFSDKPAAMQREFCKRIAYFDGVPAAEIETRTKALIAFFGQHSVPIDPAAFQYKESENRNPGADVIESRFAKLGVPNVVRAIGGGVFDQIFENDSRISYGVLRECTRARSLLFHFPYRSGLDRYGFDYRAKASTSTLWEDFLEGVMGRRHTIAHGDTVANVTTWEELARDSNKLEVFMHAIAFSACNYLSRRRAQ